MAARDPVDGASRREPRSLALISMMAPMLIACAGTNKGRLEIPALSGGERVALPWRPTPDELAERASAERARKNLGAAERFARWALTLDPEHPAALIEAARVATARAERNEPPPSALREKARALESARRLYELAALAMSSPSATRDTRLPDPIAEERDRALLELAETELALGRIEQASALLPPLDAAGRAPRSRRLALHEALADAFIAGAGLLEARGHTEQAARLGASLSRTRLREAALSLATLAAKDAAVPPGSPAGEALAEARRRVETAFGQSAELFAELALLLRRSAPVQGRWAAGRAVALVPSQEHLAVEVELEWLSKGPAAGVARARELLAETARNGAKGGSRSELATLVMRLVEALHREAPRDAAALAEEGANHPDLAGPEALGLALWALNNLPAAERAPALARLFGPNAQSAERLWAGLENTPGRWAELARHALGAGDKSTARRAASLAASGSPAAALVELELALESGGDDAAIDTTLARLAPQLRPKLSSEDQSSAHEVLAMSREDPRLHALLSLELLALRGRAQLWRPDRDGVGLPAAAELAEVWRLTSTGRADLAARTLASIDPQKKDPLIALAHARWLAQGARSHEAATAWFEAIELAPSALEAATLGLAIESLWPLVLGDRLDRGPFEALLHRWLAALPSGGLGPSARDLLEGLALSTRLAPSSRIAALARLHDAGSSVGLDLRVQLLAQLPTDTPDIDDQFEDAAIAQITSQLTSNTSPSRGPTNNQPPLTERLAEQSLRNQRLELALRLYARLPASSLERLDSVVDLMKLMAGRGEPERARRYVRAVLARTEPSKNIASGRMTALGDNLLEVSEWALARECFERAQALGDRSSRPLLGAIRASLRLGDEDGAERVANQWLASRPTRDARVYDELAHLFRSEGRLERALELTRARVSPARDERRGGMDGNVFVAIADLLKRGGQHDALSAEAQAFAESDTRGAHRAHVLAAQKLLEVGRPAEALALLQRGLTVRPRDSSLLSAALTAALAARDPKAEALATRLLTEAPATWDLWARVLEDMRASGQGEAAQRLADLGLQRSPGQPRLLIARGRVLLSLGRGDLALADFAEGLARADEPRQAMAQIEEALQRSWQDERLASITARALALSPGRADLTLDHADALIAAGREAEAQRLLARLLAESDRGHTAVAAAWFRRGFLGRALEHWTRGFDQLDDREALDAMAMVSQSLANTVPSAPAGPSGHDGADRVGMIERLFVQTQRGTKSPSLLPLGQLHAALGDRAQTLAWLERADLENPTADTARALFEHHLADLSAERGPSGEGGAGDRTHATLLTHGERAISRAQAAQAPGRGVQNTLSILQLLTDQLLERRHPDLAALLAVRAARHVPGLGPRLVAARALVRAGRLGDALDQLGDILQITRNNREALPLLNRLVEDLVEVGHADAALGLLTRADALEKDRELRVARLRVAIRAGHPEQALIIARQLAVQQPVLNQWLMAEALAAERMPRVAGWFAADALAQGPLGNVRDRVTRVLAVAVGLQAALAASPGLAGDRWERAGVAARVGLSLAGTAPTGLFSANARGATASTASSATISTGEALLAAHRAFLETLRAGPLDPQATWSALGLAGLLDSARGPDAPDAPGDMGTTGDDSERPANRIGPRLDATIDAIASHASSHGKQLEESGRALAALGLADPARRVFIAARDLNPGHLPLALEGARVTLAAGRPRALSNLLGRGFSGVESPPYAARMEVAAIAAAHGESDTALELVARELSTSTGPALAAGTTALAARARVLALVTAEASLWDEAIASWLAAAPDESVARVEVARFALTTTRPGSPATARAMALLEPLLGAGRAPQPALELALVAAMRLLDLDRARALADELARRFPGPPLDGALLVEAALSAGHAPLLAAVLASAPPAALHEVLDAVARQRTSARPTQSSTSPSDFLDRLASELAPPLDARLARPALGLAPLATTPGDPRPTPLEARVMLHLSLGENAEARALAASAHDAAPSSERAALLHAATLARGGGSPTEVARILSGLGQALRGSLMETESRLLAAHVNPRVHLARAELHLALGENTQALQAWRRHRIEVTPRPASQPALRAPEGRPPWAPAPDPFFATPDAAAHLSLGLALADRSALTGADLRGFLASCVAAQRAPWSGLCRSRQAR